MNKVDGKESCVVTPIKVLWSLTVRLPEVCCKVQRVEAIVMMKAFVGILKSMKSIGEREGI